MKPSLEVFESHIVIVGSFNPPVISPSWLKENGLIGAEDEKVAMESPSLAITPEISRFETEWFWLQVIGMQMSLNSKGPVTPAIKDLAVGIFSLLLHTPVTAVGLNATGHYKVYSQNDYHKIGDVLAPKTIWNSFYSDSDTQTVGLTELSLEIHPWKRGGERKNVPHRRVSLGVSDKVENGVRLNFNHHFPILADEKKKKAGEVLIDIIESDWQSSMDEAEKLFGCVLNQAIDA